MFKSHHCLRNILCAFHEYEHDDNFHCVHKHWAGFRQRRLKQRINSILEKLRIDAQQRQRSHNNTPKRCQRMHKLNDFKMPNKVQELERMIGVASVKNEPIVAWENSTYRKPHEVFWMDWKSKEEWIEIHVNWKENPDPNKRKSNWIWRTERNGIFVRSFGPRNKKITILNVECIEWLSKCWTFDKDHRVIKLKCGWTQLKCPKQFQYFNAPAISFIASSLPFRCISSSNSLKMLNYVCGIFFLQAIALFGASHSKTILAKWFFVLFAFFSFQRNEKTCTSQNWISNTPTYVIYRTDSKNKHLKHCNHNHFRRNSVPNCVGKKPNSDSSGKI